MKMYDELLTATEEMQEIDIKNEFGNLFAETKENVSRLMRDNANAGKYSVDVMKMTGFLDGINDSLKVANPIETMDEDTEVSLGFDKELLYKNMVAAEADWLYNLEEWNAIFDEDKKKALYKEQKSSTTVVKGDKVYPNDPCPCGSGKKYKHCCGRQVAPTGYIALELVQAISSESRD